MATVDKNFKIKSGLVVEGTTGTINGSDIITEDKIVGGSQTNIAVTYNPSTGMVDFAAENGVADSTTDDLVEGQNNLYFTTERAIAAVSGGNGGATSSNVANTIILRDGFGNFAASQIDLDSKLTTPDVRFGNAGKVYDNNGNLDIVGYNNNDVNIEAPQNVNISTNNADINLNPDGNVKIWGDVVATQAYSDQSQTNAQAYADTVSSNAYNNAVSDAATDATAKANSAQSNAESFATSADTALYSTVTSDISTAKSEAISSSNTYTDTAVANLVDAAPEMLNTLNELAASLGDNADFIGTVNSAIGEKVAKAGDTMTGELVLFGSPTQGNAAATKSYVDDASSAAYNGAVNIASDDATTKANAAESSANTYTDNSIASGNSNASPTYKEIDITWATKNVGSYAYLPNIETAAIYAWSINYASAKFIVRTRNGNHSQVSEILVTADINKNLAITEYGIVGTNGNIADIAADYDSVNNQYRLLATTTATGTEAIVSGILMAYGD